jgi:hypothetical protein
MIGKAASAVSLQVKYSQPENIVSINWTKTDNESREFILQKAIDGTVWTNIAFQKVTDFNNNQSFRFIDKDPGKGVIYYRLKITSSGGSYGYSAVAKVNIESYTYEWSIYPDPSGDKLLLRYKGTAPLKGVLNIRVQNTSGAILTRMRFASTSTVIEVPTLNIFRGIYVISVIIEDNLVWSRQFVK